MSTNTDEPRVPSKSLSNAGSPSLEEVAALIRATTERRSWSREILIAGIGGVISAGLIGFYGFSAQFVTNGALIKAVGGATKTDLAALPKFGGFYSVEDHSASCPDGSENTRNPFTNAQSCPDGFETSRIGRVLAGDHQCGVTQFICFQRGALSK